MHNVSYIYGITNIVILRKASFHPDLEGLAFQNGTRAIVIGITGWYGSLTLHVRLLACRLIWIAFQVRTMQPSPVFGMNSLH